MSIFFQMGWFNHQLVTSSLVVRFLENRDSRFFFGKTLSVAFLESLEVISLFGGVLMVILV